MYRRRFLTLLASATVVAAMGRAAARAEGTATVPALPTVLPPPPATARVPLPGGGALMRLPGDGDLLALTIDDGANTEVIRAYTQFAKDTGVRFTFFVTGQFPGWGEHIRLLRPLVESGQVQLANHTWSHPDLTGLSQVGVIEELARNGEFLRRAYGVEPAPYYRPPYGAFSPAVVAAAAEIGYAQPVMWYGSLSDSGLVTESYIIEMAHQYFHRQAIVIGHANFDPVTRVYAQLIEVIRARNLRTVTLRDVFI